MSGIPKKTKSVVWSVGNIAAGDPYEPGENHDPDTDSNGTSITVRR